MKYVAFLRGINVGAGHKVPMVDLKACLVALGLTEVRTYINSGNVVFSAEGQVSDLVETIEAALIATFGFKIPTILRTEQELKSVLEELPEGFDPTKSHIVFCELVRPSLIEELLSEGFTDQDFAVQNRHFYLHLLGGVSQSEISLFLSKKKRLEGATMRTYRTVQKVYGFFD